MISVIKLRTQPLFLPDFDYLDFFRVVLFCFGYWKNYPTTLLIVQKLTFQQIKDSNTYFYTTAKQSCWKSWGSSYFHSSTLESCWARQSQTWMRLQRPQTRLCTASNDAGPGMKIFMKNGLINAHFKFFFNIEFL